MTDDYMWLRDQLHYIKQRLEKLEAAAKVPANSVTGRKSLAEIMEELPPDQRARVEERARVLIEEEKARLERRRAAIKEVVTTEAGSGHPLADLEEKARLERLGIRLGDE
jgi:small-conductance mechanosensitive channel